MSNKYHDFLNLPINLHRESMGLAKAKKSNLKHKNINELKTVVQAGWNSISLETCQKYSKSFSK